MDLEKVMEQAPLQATKEVLMATRFRPIMEKVAQVMEVMH